MRAFDRTVIEAPTSPASILTSSTLRNTYTSIVQSQHVCVYIHGQHPLDSHHASDTAGALLSDMSFVPCSFAWSCMDTSMCHVAGLILDKCVHEAVRGLAEVMKMMGDLGAESLSVVAVGRGCDVALQYMHQYAHVPINDVVLLFPDTPSSSSSASSASSSSLESILDACISVTHTTVYVHEGRTVGWRDGHVRAMTATTWTGQGGADVVTVRSDDDGCLRNDIRNVLSKGARVSGLQYRNLT